MLRRLPRSMGAWVTLEGAGALNTTTLALLRRNVKLDYWPPPAASHKMPAVCFRRSLVRAPVPPSLGGREHMCDCTGVVCVHGCGAVVPRCLEEVRPLGVLGSSAAWSGGQPDVRPPAQHRSRALALGPHDSVPAGAGALRVGGPRVPHRRRAARAVGARGKLHPPSGGGWERLGPCARTLAVPVCSPVMAESAAASHAGDMRALPKILRKASAGGAHGHPQHRRHRCRAPRLPAAQRGLHGAL